MPARRLDRLRRRVEPRHPRAQARQRLADQPPAAAHIEHAQARERPQPGPGQRRNGEPSRRAGSASRAGPIGAARGTCRWRPTIRWRAARSGRSRRDRASRQRRLASACSHGELARCSAALSRSRRAPPAAVAEPALWLRVGASSRTRGSCRLPRPHGAARGTGPRQFGALTRVVMSFLVMKFGGTSVANVERIRNVARHVKREVDAGNKVAVVVSAMAGVTNQLVAWVREASPLHDAREYDAVVATGEQVTAGLLAIVLQSMGIQARSWQGWQIPIITDNAHGVARIKDIPGDKIRARLEQGEVAVITGFQGIEPERNRISTLGRGGSDTSAVAIAVARQGRPLRHLHRRRRRLHHRPAHRAAGRAGCPRSPTRRCWRWPRSAPRCCRRARSSLPWYTGCACACCRASSRREAPAARAAGNLGRDRHHHLQRG